MSASRVTTSMAEVSPEDFSVSVGSLRTRWFARRDAALPRTHLALAAAPSSTCQQATRTFRGEDFAVQLSVQDTSADPALRVVCERLRDHELWSADFAATCACA